MRFLSLFLSLFCASSVYSASYEIKAADAAVFEAKAKALSFIPIDFEGEGADLNGKIVIDSGKADVSLWTDINDIKTGNETRDEHMLEMFLSKKHPKAKLKIKDLPVKSGEFEWEGMLELRGVEKPVKGSAVVSEDKGKYQVKAWFWFDLKTYGISEKDMAMVSEYVSKVEKDVKVKVSFDFGGY